MWCLCVLSLTLFHMNWLQNMWEKQFWKCFCTSTLFHVLFIKEWMVIFIWNDIISTRFSRDLTHRISEKGVFNHRFWLWIFILCMYTDLRYLGCCFVIHVYYEYRKEGEEVLAKGVTKFTAKYFVYVCMCGNRRV